MASSQSVIQLIVYLGVLLAAAWPLGRWLVAVAEGRLPKWLAPLAWLERGLYRVAGVDPAEHMGWKRYAFGLVAFNIVGVVIVYALQRLQGVLPLNPQSLAAVSADSCRRRRCSDTSGSFSEITRMLSDQGFRVCLNGVGTAAALHTMLQALQTDGPGR